MSLGCAGAGGPLPALSQGLVMPPESAQAESCTARATAAAAVSACAGLVAQTQHGQPWSAAKSLTHCERLLAVAPAGGDIGDEVGVAGAALHGVLDILCNNSALTFTAAQMRCQL